MENDSSVREAAEESSGTVEKAELEPGKLEWEIK